MNDDFEYSKSYQRVAAAEEQIERSSLLDYYVSLYKKKYKSEPIFPVTSVTQNQIKELHRVMKDKARDTVTAYFSMRDDWFDKQHHSLECLLKNLSKVNVQVSRQVQNRDLKNKLTLQFYCDSCQREFTLLWPMDSTYCDKLVRCVECTASNRPGMKAKNKRLTLDLPTL